MSLPIPALKYATIILNLALNGYSLRHITHKHGTSDGQIPIAIQFKSQFNRIRGFDLTTGDSRFDLQIFAIRFEEERFGAEIALRRNFCKCRMLAECCGSNHSCSLQQTVGLYCVESLLLRMQVTE